MALKDALYFAAIGLVVGFIVALFLKETAPRYHSTGDSRGSTSYPGLMSALPVV